MKTTCPHCSTTFEVVHFCACCNAPTKGAKYCSAKCRVYSFRDRKAESVTQAKQAKAPVILAQQSVTVTQQKHNVTTTQPLQAHLNGKSVTVTLPKHIKPVATRPTLLPEKPAKRHPLRSDIVYDDAPF